MVSKAHGMTKETRRISNIPAKHVASKENFCMTRKQSKNCMKSQNNKEIGNDFIPNILNISVVKNRDNYSNKNRIFERSNISNLGGTVNHHKASKLITKHENGTLDNKLSPRLFRSSAKKSSASQLNKDKSGKPTPHKMFDQNLDRQRAMMEFVPISKSKAVRKSSLAQNDVDNNIETSMKSSVATDTSVATRDSRPATSSKNYMKRTFSSTFKGKMDKKPVIKNKSIKRASSRCTNLDKPFLQMPSKTNNFGLVPKTRNLDTPVLGKNASIRTCKSSNISASREKNSVKTLRQNIHSKQQNQDYCQQTATKCKFESLLSLKYRIARRTTITSGERMGSANKSNSKNSTSHIREMTSTKDSEYGQEAEECQFKAKDVPKSHKIKPMIMHSTKELTKFKVFNFHYKGNQEAEQDDGCEDLLAQVIQPDRRNYRVNCDDDSMDPNIPNINSLIDPEGKNQEK